MKVNHWYWKNRARIRLRETEPMICECGAVIQRGSKYKHILTKSHHQNMMEVWLIYANTYATGI